TSRPAPPAPNRPFARTIHAPPAPTSYAAFRLFHGTEPPTLSIKDQVAVAVAERIIDGRLKPGERIPEQLISDEFHISKAPVSEALMLLEYAGLVESAARRSAYVPVVSAQDFAELREYRLALARVFLPRFFGVHQQTDRAILRAHVVELEKLAGQDDRAFEFVELIDRTTLYVASRAGNQRIARTIFSISLQVLRYFRLGSQTVKERRAVLAHYKRTISALDA